MFDEVIRPLSTPHAAALGWLRRPVPPALLALLLLLSALLVAGASWTCDDAFITYRVVDNALSGHGLRWNADERVQAFTHPLWLLLLVAGTYVSHNVVAASTALGVLFSVTTLGTIIRGHARTVAQALLAVLLFFASKACLDYTTSGLENALSHACLALLLRELLRTDGRAPGAARAAGWSALLALNRLDLSLLAAPALLWLWLSSWRREPRRLKSAWRATGAMAAGMAPLLAWLIFSVVYYGFPFPNTAYAKLGTGIAPGIMVTQGLHYLEHALRFDPLTPLVILVAVVMAMWRGSALDRAVAAGVLLYGLYVVKIGGCFMAGRFLAAPYVASIILLLRVLPLEARRFACALVVVAAALGWTYFPVARSLLQSGAHYPLVTAHDIHDEHALYHPFTGLLRRFTHPRVGVHPWVAEGLEARKRGDAAKERVVLVEDNIGFSGYHAGPKVHLIDPAALSDPLLARLPQSGMWKIGHFYRPLPDGYLETVRTGTNVIRDPRIARLYDDLGEVTRGDLFTASRWRTILRLNLHGRATDGGTPR